VSDVTFQPVRDVDIQAVASLAGVIWRRHYPGIISAAQIDYMLDRMYAPETIRAELCRGVAWVKVMVGGELAGLASFGPVDDGAAMKLHKLYLLESVRGRGTGSAAIAYVAAEARKAGFNRLVLAVNKKNTGAIRAYEKNGFVIEKAVVSEFGGGFVMDDFIMVKPL
jgi:GNAT superfamily N-acetyltransferase